MHLLHRNRRLRQNEAIRSLVRENHLTPHDFLVPLFICEGKGIRQEISSMPGYFRYSLDLITKEVQFLWSLGLKSVLVFVKVADHLKDNKGTEAYNSDGLMQRAVKTIKDAVPEMLVMTDVALDPYSSYGHDGIVHHNQILNDPTVEVLAKMSLSHAKAGADFVAPSDMMDGRIKAIRNTLEQEGFINTGIMSYSAKYASAFYGPFRDALDSAPGFGDKKTYQMDFAGGAKEAILESIRDQNEGADILMVKPGMSYLDILSEVSKSVSIPVAVYQVSGEYAMLQAAHQKGWLAIDKVMYESLIAFKRAGAQMIASYFAIDFAKKYNL